MNLYIYILVKMLKGYFTLVFSSLRSHIPFCLVLHFCISYHANFIVFFLKRKERKAITRSFLVIWESVEGSRALCRAVSQN